MAFEAKRSSLGGKRADTADTAKRRATEAARALIGMAVVELAFHFLDGPADVLRAATACRRWHELATADSVEAKREGMVEKAGVRVQVALPAERTHER